MYLTYAHLYAFSPQVRIDECNAFSLFGQLTEVVGSRAAAPGSAEAAAAEAAAAAGLLAAAV